MFFQVPSSGGSSLEETLLRSHFSGTVCDPLDGWLFLRGNSNQHPPFWQTVHPERVIFKAVEQEEG